METRPRRPLLIVVSAPSGAGKSTLCDMLLRERRNVAYSVSCTTRAPRGREVDGEDYFFLSEPEFERRVAEGEFIEHACVHGSCYGTRRETVVNAMAAGKSVLMDIDVQGARQIRQAVAQAPAGSLLKQRFVDVFITVSSAEELRRRLVARGEDASEVIERRLRHAQVEMAAAGEYRYVVVNDDLQRAYAELTGILGKEMARDE